jgi:hypothetical protein
MPNTLLSPKIYANVMLKLLKNNLIMGKLVSTDFKNEFKKKNQKIYARRPPQFLVREGRVAAVQPVLEGEVEVVLDTQVGVDIEFTSIEETLTVDELLDDAIMQSNAATLAQYVDTAIMEKTLEFPNWVGTPGQLIDSVTDYSAGPQRLDNLSVPRTMRAGVLSVDDHWALSNSLNFHPSSADLARTAIEDAELPMVGGTNAYMSQSTINLLTGTRVSAGASLVNGAGQVKTYDQVNADYTQTIAIDGLAAGATIKAGEVFTIGGVFAINPRTKAPQSFLYQMTVLADAVADGAGAIAALKFQCPIIVGGAYATVDAAPADNAPITWMGAPSTQYRQNAVFHKSALQLTFAKLVMPRSGRAAYSTDKETGISIRYWETSDGTNDTHLHRWDLLFGRTNVDPRLGTRLSGTP